MLMSKTTAAGIMLLSVLLVQGCGRKGPLFMPQMPAKPVALAKDQTAQSQPVPTQPIQLQSETKK